MNCCGGQDACKLDRSGIPRCFGVQTNNCPNGFTGEAGCCIASGDVCQLATVASIGVRRSAARRSEAPAPPTRAAAPGARASRMSAVPRRSMRAYRRAMPASVMLGRRSSTRGCSASPTEAPACSPRSAARRSAASASAARPSSARALELHPAGPDVYGGRELVLRRPGLLRLELLPVLRHRGVFVPPRDPVTRSGNATTGRLDHGRVAHPAGSDDS